MGTKHEVVSARTLRRVVKELDRKIEHHTGGISREIGARVHSLRHDVEYLTAELKAAIARKPSAILAQLVYQLRTTRAELALVQETLEKNTAVLEKLARVMGLIDEERARVVSGFEMRVPDLGPREG